jgi:hypothetical protein
MNVSLMLAYEHQTSIDHGAGPAGPVKGMSAASTEQARIEKVLRHTDLRKARVSHRDLVSKWRG